MKLVIAGSRTLNVSNGFIRSLLAHFIENEMVTEIISGGAEGIDTCAMKFAHHYEIPFVGFPADWEKHGKAAGPLRNKEMAKAGDALLLIWDGRSSGSKNMREQMLREIKPIYEVILKQMRPN